MSRATCCWCGGPLVFAVGAWWCRRSEACRARQTRFATKRTVGAEDTWLYVPTPVQATWHEAMLDRSVNRLGVGGAAGPGKSRFGREALYWFARHVPGFHGILLRRTNKDLDQSHLRFMPHEVAQRGGTWKISDRLAEFTHPDGQISIIRTGHMETSGDVENYLSTEYDLIYPDETVTFLRDDMLELFSRARTTNRALYALRGGGPDDLDGSLVLCSTNPGGRGALWFRDFFVTHDVDPAAFPYYRPSRWRFYQARLEDNPYLSPSYRETLESLPPLRRKQLLEGDWLAYEGQFFGEWQETRLERPWHVRALPGPWTEIDVVGGLDWGYNAPGVMGWFACLPDGRLHQLSEFKFSQMTADAVGHQIHQQTKALGIRSLRYIACDPAIWQHTGAGKGESIAETLLRLRLPVRKSDHARFLGWLRVHEYLRDHPDGQGPFLTVDPSCVYTRRTLPALTQAKSDPDDVDTTQDDHAADMLRYVVMSRVAPSRVQVAPPPGPGTWGFETARHARSVSTELLVP